MVNEWLMPRCLRARRVVWIPFFYGTGVVPFVQGVASAEGVD